jgi:hypothetical protein
MNMEKSVRGWIAENDATGLAVEVLFKLQEKGNCTPEQVESLFPAIMAAVKSWADRSYLSKRRKHLLRRLDNDWPQGIHGNINSMCRRCRRGQDRLTRSVSGGMFLAF